MNDIYSAVNDANTLHPKIIVLLTAELINIFKQQNKYHVMLYPNLSALHDACFLSVINYFFIAFSAFIDIILNITLIITHHNIT